MVLKLKAEARVAAGFSAAEAAVDPLPPLNACNEYHMNN